MNRKTLYKIIAILVTATLLFFILHNSMYSLYQSSLQSEAVLQLINRIFSVLGIGITFTQVLVRKLAHFIEYLVFGVFLTAVLPVFGKRWNQFFFFELFLFLAVPVLDETIQLFSQGRTSSVIDVLIDFGGCMAGMGLCRLALFLFHPKKGKENP